MSQELDYRSMRILPVSLLLLMLIIPLLNISMLIVMVAFSETGLESIAAGSGFSTVYFICEFSNIVVSIISLVCLYRLNDISRYYNYAWITLIFEMISELIRQIVSSLTRLHSDSLPANIISTVFDMLPKLLVMAGVAALLNGLVEMCHEMNGYITDSEVMRVRNLSKAWYVTEIIRIIIWFILYVNMYIMTSSQTAVYGVFQGIVQITAVLSIILIVAHIIISIFIFLNTWTIFRNYYLYRYNRRI